MATVLAFVRSAVIEYQIVPQDVFFDKNEVPVKQNWDERPNLHKKTKNMDQPEKRSLRWQG